MAGFHHETTTGCYALQLQSKQLHHVARRKFNIHVFYAAQLGYLKASECTQFLLKPKPIVDHFDFRLGASVVHCSLIILLPSSGRYIDECGCISAARLSVQFPIVLMLLIHLLGGWMHGNSLFKCLYFTSSTSCFVTLRLSQTDTGR